MDVIIMIMLLLILGGFSMPVWSNNAPPLMLAKVYQHGMDLSQYLVSEKLDGVRAYWNGKQLLTRSGRVIRAPLWFIAALPRQALDGELWLGRGRFTEISGLIRRHQPDDQVWQQVRFMLFDMPDMPAGFEQRLPEFRIARMDGNVIRRRQ